MSRGGPQVCTSNDLLKIAVERGASDLNLEAGRLPMIRVRSEPTPVAQDRSKRTRPDSEVVHR